MRERTHLERLLNNLLGIVADVKIVGQLRLLVVGILLAVWHFAPRQMHDDRLRRCQRSL